MHVQPWAACKVLIGSVDLALHQAVHLRLAEPLAVGRSRVTSYCCVLLRLQAQQLGNQAKQLQAQVSVIQQQDQTLQELRSKLAAAEHSSNNSAAAAEATPNAAAAAPDADQLNDQIALAVRAVLTGVSSMASVSFPPAKDAAQMQQMVVQLPDALLQQIRTCCREVALHLKKTEVKEQPHAITVPCC